MVSPNQIKGIFTYKETESSHPKKIKVTDVMNGEGEGVKMSE